jgi:predicted naringenin-chalcone synthase
MVADIENPDGGDYVAAAAKVDANAMTGRRYPDEVIWLTCAFVCCYALAMLLYVEYEAVKVDPTAITLFIRANLCLLLLVCLAFILTNLVCHYRFGTGPFKEEEA